ncbi:hypothetical protein [uncultured Aquimarina sp.]|uniref:hypothetical protein n=1 Tax=uncultured Aquimarina sp. TaxID=575652 RepID=UPI00261D5855|nr:hypothetical protein [uncultured Aquimarina sp.]
MKKLIILLIPVFLLSCSSTEKHTEELIEKISSSKVELFKNVKIEARDYNNGVPRAFFFTKELNGKEYLLPNFLAINCKLEDSLCFKNYTDKNFDIVSFAKANNVDRKKAFKYTEEYIESVVKEYEKIGVYKILSSSQIGDCIIFYINQDEFLAYVQDINKVFNNFWKTNFDKKNKISKKWYYGKI